MSGHSIAGVDPKLPDATGRFRAAKLQTLNDI
jgi:hypothetical protein